MYQGLRETKRAVALLLVCVTFGCAPIQIESNPDAFPVPLAAAPQLRGQQSIDLVNAYKVATEARIFLGGPGWVADLRQYTQSAITLLARELRKGSVTVEPAAKSIVLRVHSVQAAPGAFLIPAALVLDAEYGNGTKSSIAEQDNASSAWRAVDGALVRAIARLLTDEGFLAYVNKFEPSAGPVVPVPRSAAAAMPAGLPAAGTLWEYELSNRLFSRQKTAVTVRALRANGEAVEESITAGDMQRGNTASRVVSTRDLRILEHRISGSAALIELSPYLLAASGGKAPAEPTSLKASYPSGSGLPGWIEAVRIHDWESISVPAGTFRALRVQVDGRRSRPVGAPGIPTLYRVSAWYAPEAGRYVRLEHQQWLNANSLYAHELLELQSYRAPN